MHSASTSMASTSSPPFSSWSDLDEVARVFCSFVPTESSELILGSSSLASEEVAASVSRGSEDPTSDFSVSVESEESDGSDEFGAASAESHGPGEEKLTSLTLFKKLGSHTSFS